MARYLAIWSTLVEDYLDPADAAKEALRLIRDPEYDAISFHVREVMDTVDEEGCNDLGAVVEVHL